MALQAFLALASPNHIGGRLAGPSATRICETNRVRGSVAVDRSCLYKDISTPLVPQIRNSIRQRRRNATTVVVVAEIGMFMLDAFVVVIADVESSW